MNSRRLGLFCMLGGLAYILNAVYSSITGTGDIVGMPNTLFSLVWALGAICGWLAILQLKGTGENAILRLLPLIPIVGLSVVLIATAYGLFTAGSVTFSPVYAIGFLLEMVGALLVGIFAFTARWLSGWHRFAPFFIVVGVIAGALVSSASQGAILGIPLFIGIAYTLLGYAVRAEQGVPIVDQPLNPVPG
jgi:hypothetical protein